MNKILTESIRGKCLEFAKKVSEKLRNCPNIERIDVNSLIKDSSVNINIIIRCKTEDFASYCYMFLNLVLEPELDKYVRIIKDGKIVKVIFTYVNDDKGI